MDCVYLMVVMMMVVVWGYQVDLDASEEFYSSSAIRKAILLTR